VSGGRNGEGGSTKTGVNPVVLERSGSTAVLLFALGGFLFGRGFQRGFLCLFFGVLSFSHGVNVLSFPGRSKRGYFFLLAAAFALVACCALMSAVFCWAMALLFDCFCDACFWTDFGDLSPMEIALVELIHLREIRIPTALT
jgi:hypothetical protein